MRQWLLGLVPQQHKKVVSLYTGRRKKQGSPQGEHRNRKRAAAKSVNNAHPVSDATDDSPSGAHDTKPGETSGDVGLTRKSNNMLIFWELVFLSQMTSSVSHTALIPLDVCTALHRPSAHIQASIKFAGLTACGGADPAFGYLRKVEPQGRYFLRKISS